jgi:hypothetical protein
MFSLSLSVDELSVDEVSVDAEYVDNSELDPFLLSTLISLPMSEFERWKDPKRSVAVELPILRKVFVLLILISVWEEIEVLYKRHHSSLGKNELARFGTEGYSISPKLKPGRNDH